MQEKVQGKGRKALKPGTKLFLATLPFLILYFLFAYLPIYGWMYAFTDYQPGKKLQDLQFVGFKYFTYMFQNPMLRRNMFRSLRNTVGMSTINLCSAFIPMFFAILLNEITSPRYKKIVQSLSIVPNFIGWIVIYGIVFNMFAPSSGVVNQILAFFGKDPINILSSSEHVWLTMFLLGLWKGLGWSAVIYMSAINAVDQELYEAAAIDGAGRFQKMRYITIPELMPTFVTLVILSIGNFISSDFSMLYAFQNAFNKEWIETLDLYVYNLAFGSGDISFSTAVGITKTLVGLALLFFSNWLSGKFREEKIF